MRVGLESGTGTAQKCLLPFTCLLMLLAGCGGSSNSIPVPTVPGKTVVTVIATSTANTQLSEFDVSFNSIKLTSESGNTVDLLPAMEHAEFMHRNGSPEPLFATNVAEDTYTSATAQIGPERIVCMGTLPNGMNRTSTLDYGYTPDDGVTIVLPQAITVSGSSMVLMIDLKVAQSASWIPGACPTSSSYSLTPTFELSALTAGDQPVKLRLLAGLVTATNKAVGSFSVQAGDGSVEGQAHPSGSAATWAAPAWTVAVNGSTAFKNVSGLSMLAAGMPVVIDGSLQGDGSILASRVTASDMDTQTLSVVRGPLARVDNFQSAMEALGTEQYGYFNDVVSNAGFMGVAPFSYGSASFKIADGEASNLLQLPFVPSFGPTNMVAGQAISITWHGDNEQPAPIYLPAATVTLLPQIINGTVQSISDEGVLQKYVVALPSYDLFPQLANEALQSTPLIDPGTVIVYADSNTERKNAVPIATGSVLRFNGLVFNDAGALKMDCSAIDDGVAD